MDFRIKVKNRIKFFAGSEAFLGAFLLAYFVVIVSRKIMR